MILSPPRSVGGASDGWQIGAHSLSSNRNVCNITSVSTRVETLKLSSVGADVSKVSNDASSTDSHRHRTERG
jgi:hypothetical protein